MSLPSVRVGDPIRAEHIQQIVEEVRRMNPVAGMGMRMEKTPSGTVFSIAENDSRRNSGGGGIVSGTLDPWRLVIGYPEDPAYPVLRIHGESYLSAIETGELIPITGNLPLGAIIGSGSDNLNDPGQFPLPEIGESVWLECSVDGLTIASATLKKGNPFAEGWINYPDPIQMAGNDPYTVSKSRVLIAHVVAAADPRKGSVYTVGNSNPPQQRKVLQQVTTHLGVQVLMMRGIAAPVIVPWHGPFIIA